MSSEKMPVDRRLKGILLPKYKKGLSTSKKQNLEDNVLIPIPHEKRESKSNSISQTANLIPSKRRYAVAYWDFCLFVSLLNNLGTLPTPTANYKAFVGKGNNSILIKTMIKNRFWWNIADNDS